MSEVKDALERIISNAVYGIGSGDYEIMNKGGFDKDMERHNLDAEIVRQALEVNQELVDALKYVVGRVEEIRLDAWWIDCPDKGGIDIEQIEKALAKAEAVGVIS